MISELNPWHCTACGFEAYNSNKKIEHMSKTKNDPHHVVIFEKEHTMYYGTMLQPVAYDQRYSGRYHCKQTHIQRLVN